MHIHAVEIIALLLLSGLLRPFGWNGGSLVSLARPQAGDHGPPTQGDHDPPADIARDHVRPPPQTLSPIELALIAELNLEMARANEAVAEDVSKGLETRRRASDIAATWRRRAELFHAQARRQSSQAFLPDCQPIGRSAEQYSGPERRKNVRRQQARRLDPAALRTRNQHSDRRGGAERRRQDRRRPELAPR